MVKLSNRISTVVKLSNRIYTVAKLANRIYTVVKLSISDFTNPRSQLAHLTSTVQYYTCLPSVASDFIQLVWSVVTEGLTNK